MVLAAGFLFYTYTGQRPGQNVNPNMSFTSFELEDDFLGFAATFAVEGLAALAGFYKYESGQPSCARTKVHSQPPYCDP